MTLVSNIIKNAYRETNLIAIGVTPNGNEITEALDRLNAIVMSTVGNEVGDGLDDLTLGGTYDQSFLCSNYIPDDARLILNLSSAKTLNLDPHPYEGQRLSFKDIGGNIATYNLTITGNGRLIEGAASLVLNANSDSRQWMYRSDTGNWMRITDLLSSDPLPFPEEFDDYFITMLAMRLNPRNSAVTGPDTILALKRSRNQLRGRYHNYRQVSSDLDTRGYNSDPRSTGGFTNMNEFNTGRPWPYL